MSTMTLSGAAPAAFSQSTAGHWPKKRGRAGRVVFIAAVHAGLFYMLQSGMLQNAVRAVMPQVVNVTFVSAPTPPEQAPPPKTVEMAHKAPAVTPPPLPLLNIQIENTITVPPAPARVTHDAPTAMVAAPPQPAPVAAPSPATPRTVQGVEYVRAPQPVYPSISRRLGESGVVMLRVLISEKGMPEQAVVQKSSGSNNLDEAGRQAAMRSLFKPYVEDGKPVAVYVLVPINFQLS